MAPPCLGAAGGQPALFPAVPLLVALAKLGQVLTHGLQPAPCHYRGANSIRLRTHCGEKCFEVSVLPSHPFFLPRESRFQVIQPLPREPPAPKCSSPTQPPGPAICGGVAGCALSRRHHSCPGGGCDAIKDTKRVSKWRSLWWNSVGSLLCP